jgi:branched-chain amino acid transport system ATP-binding protein/urea transport system ATP-binding protein
LVLRIEDLRAGYGKTPILHGVSVEVGRGETVAVLGRNGAGKTTLLRAAMGLVEAYSGSINLDGRDLSGQPAHERARRGLAYVPQGRDIFPGLSVLDNLRVAAFGTRQRNVDERVETVISELPALRSRLAVRGSSLSGGQQQMLAIGRALMCEPRVLLLDEPSEGLAPTIIEEIDEIVRSASERRGLTVVLVEQNLDVAGRLASEAVVLEKGEIVRRLPARQILADEDLQRQYMGI